MTPTDPDVFDEVMQLSNELCAHANPRDPSAFVALLKRFTHAVIVEAFDREDEIRALLAMPRAVVPAIGPARCVYCGDELDARHECVRMRELGLDAPRETSSTGAACADSSADHLNSRAASDVPAAPSTEPSTQTGDHDGTSLAATRRLDERQPHCEQPHAAPVPRSLGRGEGADAGAEGRGAGVREYAASDRRDGRERGAPGIARAVVGADEDRGSRHVGGEARHEVGQPIATPGSSKPPPPLSGVAADGAGAPPAGPPSGGEASHSPRSKITHEQFAALRAACFAARRDNDDRLPIGWIKQQAEALGVTYQTVYSRLYTTMREPLPATKPAEETRRHQHTVPPDAEPPRLAGLDRDGSPLPARKSAPDAEPELVHTETPACWCRRQPANRDNVWCKLRRVDKPVTAHPALRKDPPRAERYKVRRMHGTYGGG